MANGLYIPAGNYRFIESPSIDNSLNITIDAPITFNASGATMSFVGLHIFHYSNSDNGAIEAINADGSETEIYTIEKGWFIPPSTFYFTFANDTSVSFNAFKWCDANIEGGVAPDTDTPTADSVKAKIQSLITKANTITGKSDTDLTGAVLSLAEGYGVGEDSPLPIKVSSATEMNALLSTAEVGSVYKYKGTSGTYENGALYIVEAVS